jgi:hypothetical protein
MLMFFLFVCLLHRIGYIRGDLRCVCVCQTADGNERNDVWRRRRTCFNFTYLCAQTMATENGKTMKKKN